jgi:hypothetical protein
VSSAATAVLVGPRFSPSHSAALDVDWLADTADAKVIDERRIMRAMQHMAARTL